MKKLALLPLVLLAACSDNGPKVPKSLKFAADQVELEMVKNVGMRLDCKPAEVAERWAVHCRSDSKAKWVGPAFEIYEDLNANFGVVAVPVNGKAMQYGERFQDLSLARYQAGQHLDYSDVRAAFEQAYPVK